MENFTSDGGHLGCHLEHLKFLNDTSWADSNSIPLPLQKSPKTCLGGIFCKVDLSRCRTISNCHKVNSQMSSTHSVEIIINVFILMTLQFEL